METDIYQVTETKIIFNVGGAVENGDNFFDAVAQGLRQIKPEIDFTVKSLRRACKEIAVKDWQLRNEVRRQILRDAREPQDKSITVPAFDISDSKLWDAYLERIEYTFDEIEKIRTENDNLYKSLTDSRYGSTLQVPIRGRPDIDGRLISKKYNIIIHYLTKRYYMSRIIEQSGHKVVLDKHDFDYDAENLIHVMKLTRGLFMPMFKVSQSQLHYDTPYFKPYYIMGVYDSGLKTVENGFFINVESGNGELPSTVEEVCNRQGTSWKEARTPHTSDVPQNHTLKVSVEEQLANHRVESGVKEIELEDFFPVLGHGRKLERMLKNVTEKKLAELYHSALHSKEKEYMTLAESIEELAKKTGSKTLKHHLKSKKLSHDFSLEVAAAFQRRGAFENVYLNDVFKLIDLVQIVLERYQKFKTKQSYKQYVMYDEFLRDRNPNKLYDLLDHQLEILFFKIISERIDKLKLKLKWDVLDELQFFLIRFNYFLKKKEFVFPYQSKTEMSDLFHALNIPPTHGFFMYEQKKLLFKYLKELSDKLETVKNELRENVNTDGIIKVESKQLRMTTGITNGKGDHKELYEDYWIVRDIDSLYRIINYLELVKSVDLNDENELGMLIIERVIQVIGEFMKSSHFSPYLSAETKEHLKNGGVPVEILIRLRDHISHSFSLCSRINIESMGNDFFIQIKSELVELKKIVVIVLKIVESKQIQWQLRKVIDFILYDNSCTQHIYKAIEELNDFKNKQMKLLLAQSNSNKFNVIENFSSNLKLKEDTRQISEAFNNRLKTLKTILDWYLNKKPKPCGNPKDTLIGYYTKNRKLQATVDLLLLDLMSVLADRKLILKGLVTEDLPFVIGFWSNASLRNFLGHGSTYVCYNPEDLSSKIFISSALNFINDEKEVTALVKLYEDEQIKTILCDLIKDNSDTSVDKLREEWLNKTHETKIQTKLNEHRDSIAIILKSTEYTTNLIDMLFLRNNLPALIKKKAYKEVIKKLNESQNIDVNARDENFDTLLRHVIRNGQVKKMKELVSTLIEKDYLMNDDDIKDLKKGESIFDDILHVIIQKDSVENFKKMKGDSIAETGKNDLCIAARAGSFQVVSYLLREGVNPNGDIGGYTPLDYAAQGGHLHIVVELMKSKAKYVIGKPKKYSLLPSIKNILKDFKERKNKSKETQSKKEELDRKIENYEKIYSLVFKLLLEALFENIESGNDEVINELKRLDSNEWEVVRSARNEKGHTLFQVAITNQFKDMSSTTREEIVSKLLEILNIN